MKKTRSLVSACFFLCGTAAFAALPWIHRGQTLRFLNDEPFYHSPVTLYSDRLLIRNDVIGKGRFGASRGSRGQRSHKGVDFLTPVGNPILAAKSGRVLYAGIDKGFGWYAAIRHPDGRSTRYAHLSRLSVATGEWVGIGQKIGACGKSGNADDLRVRPHLHFEILEKSKPVDPLRLFEPSLTIK